MKSLRFKRSLAFLMSVILTITSLSSDFTLLTARAEDRNPLVVSTETKDGIKLTKSAVVNDDNTVDITFTVKGNKATQITPTTGKTDIVLVIDASNSMEEIYNGVTRLARAKKAATDFVDGIFNDSTVDSDNVRIGVVRFYRSANVVSKLCNKADATTLKAAINDIKAVGGTGDYAGTNVQAGLKFAQDVLGRDNDNNKIIIVLTDGEATRNYPVANNGAYTETFDLNYTEANTPGSTMPLVGFNYNVTPTTTGISVKLNATKDYKEAGWYKADGTKVDITKVDGVASEGNIGIYTVTATKSVSNKSVYLNAWDGKYYFNRSNPLSAVLPNGATEAEYVKSNKVYYYSEAGKDIYVKKDTLSNNNKSATVVIGTEQVVYQNQVGYDSATFSGLKYAAIIEAEKAKKAGAKIYSIVYDTKEADAIFEMKNVASKTGDVLNYYSADSTTAGSTVADVFASIKTNVSKDIAAANGTRVVDELPSYMSYAKDSSGKNIISENGKASTHASINTAGKLVWDLSDTDAYDLQSGEYSITVRCDLDIEAMIREYATNAGMEYDAYKAYMAGNDVEFALNKEVTLSYKDVSGTDVEDKSISVSNSYNVPVDNFDVYPYTINYTINGEASESYPSVTGYGYKGESIGIDVYSQSPAVSSDVTVTRGENTISADAEGNYSFAVNADAAGTTNVINVALTSATHTVTFVVDGEKYAEQTVAHGEAATDPNPTKEGYTFGGWDKVLTNITEDTTINGSFSINKYTVNFIVTVDGVKDESQSKTLTDVSYNEVVNVPSVTAPADTAKLKYTTTGWSIDSTASVLADGKLTVKGNTTATINYVSETRKYDVEFIFIDYAGNEKLVRKDSDVLYGSKIGDAPDYSDKKAQESAEFVYSYSEWKYADGTAFEATDTVKGLTTVYVKETSKKHPYTITYKYVTVDESGKEEISNTKTVNAAYGDPLQWPTDLYTEKKDTYAIEYTYTKDSLPATVTGEATFTVKETATRKSYSVKLVVVDNGTSTTIKEDTFAAETVLTGLHDYTVKGKEGYTAQDIDWKWDDSITVTGNIDLTTTVNYDINKYNVTFVEIKQNEDGTESRQQLGEVISVEHGSTLNGKYPDVTEDADNAQYTYTLGAWSVNDSTPITKDTTVTITQTRKVNEYAITYIINYVEEDGETTYKTADTKSVTMAYGSDTSKDAPTLPTAKELDSQEYEYEVTGFGDFAAVTGTATYEATVKRIKKTYTVTFKDAEIDRTYTFTEKYGTEITMPAITAKADDDTFTYSLVVTDGWVAGENYTIVDNAQFVAYYTSDYKNYTITFKVHNPDDEADTIVGTTTVHYNDAVSANDCKDYNSDYKNAYVTNGEYTYTLTDFNDSYNVTELNQVVYATWTKAPTLHTITYVVDGKETKNIFAFGATVEVISDPTKDGYDFTEWTWESPEGTLNGAPKTMPAYDVTATANFAPKTYTVKVNYLEQVSEGEKVNVLRDPITKLVKFDAEYKVETPKVEHFTALTDEISGTFDAAKLAKVDSEGVLEFTVYYTRDSYKVQFVDCNGKLGDEQIVKYGSDAVAPTANIPAVTYSNDKKQVTVYKFDKWSADYTNVSKNLTVEAQYKSETLTIAPVTADDYVVALKDEVVTGNIFANDETKGVKINAIDKADIVSNGEVIGTITIADNGDYSISFNKVVDNFEYVIEYTYSKDYKAEAGTYDFTYKGNEKIISNVYDAKTLAFAGKTETYNGGAYTLDAATAPEGMTVVYKYNGNDYRSIDELKFENAGSYEIKAVGTYTYDNRTFTDEKTATLVINPKEITYKVEDLTKTYGDADPTPVGAFAGMIQGKEVEIPVTISIAPHSENADKYEGIISTDLTLKQYGNYKLTEVKNGSLTINKKNIVVRTSGDKYYDGKSIEFSVEKTTGVNGEVLVITFANDSKDAGTYAISNFKVELKNGADKVGNYNVTGSATYEIKPRNITVKANDEVIVKGQSFDYITPNAKVTSGEFVEYVTVTAAWNDPEVLKIADGSNSLEEGELKDAIIPAVTSDDRNYNKKNYNITYVNGTLTVKPQTATSFYVLKPGATLEKAEKNGQNYVNQSSSLFESVGAGTFAKTFEGKTYTEKFGENKGNYNGYEKNEQGEVIIETKVESLPVTAPADALKTYKINNDEYVLSAVDWYVVKSSNGSSDWHIDGVGTWSVVAPRISLEDITLTYNGENQKNAVISDINKQITEANKKLDGNYTIVANTAADSIFKDVADSKTVTLTLEYTGLGGLKTRIEKTVNVTITPAEAKVIAKPASKVYGDADPEFEVEFEGLYGEDKIPYTISRSEGEDVGTYDITVAAGATSNENYKVTYVGSEFKITEATLTVTAKDATKTYGDADPEFEIASVEGLKNDDTVESLGGFTVSRSNEDENVGTYENVLVVNEKELSNYTLVRVPADFEITKKHVTYTVDDVTITYGDPEEEIFTGSFAEDDMVGNDDVQPTFIGRDDIEGNDSKNVGKYVITATIADDNYEIEVVPGTLTIDPFEIKESAAFITVTKTYGDADPDFNANANKLLILKELLLSEEDAAKVDLNNITIYRVDPDTNRNVGEYALYIDGITVKEADVEEESGNDIRPFALIDENEENVPEAEEPSVLDNYVIREEATQVGTLTITKRTAYVRMNDATKYVGDADPMFSASVSNTAYNDSIFVDPWRMAGEGAGTYAIHANVGENANYNIDFTPGTLTIVARQEEIIVPPVTPTRPTITPVTPTPTPVVEEEVVTPPAEEEIVEIAPEETPQAATPETEEAPQVVIEEEPVPEAAATCWIHWLILALTLVYAIYASARAVQNKRELDDEKEVQEN